MKHIKNKNTIKTQNRQKQPDKIHQKKHNKNKKQKPQKQSWLVLIILCFPSLFFFLCALVLYCLNRYTLYAVRLKSLVYKKDQNKLLTVILGSREKEESNMYERKGGQAHPSLEYIFWISGLDLWLDMVGYTHHPIKSFCMSLYTNKYYLTYFLDQRKKKVRKCMNGVGGQAHPSLEYISGLIMIGCGPG